MQRRTRYIIAAGAAGLITAAGVGVGMAGFGGEDGDEIPITGEALERASAAALAHTGGGTVTDTEVGDEESYYEVEVTLADGSEVDVQLDEQFNVVGSEVDKPGEDD